MLLHPTFVNRLVTRTPRLGDDVGHLLNLSLRAAEGTELCGVSVCLLRCCMRGDCGRRTLFFARRRARLSLELRSNSITRFSYGASL
jgi:hypothetical protein